MKTTRIIVGFGHYRISVCLRGKRPVFLYLKTVSNRQAGEIKPKVRFGKIAV